MDGKNSLQYWNFDSVLEKLNALGTKTAPRENVVLPKAEESFKDFWERRQQVRQESPLLPEREKEDVPDWLKQVAPEEDKPEVPSASVWKEEPWQQEEEPIGPHLVWDQLPENQRDRDLGIPLDDWQGKAIGGQEDEEKEVDGGGEEENLRAETEAEAAPTVVGLGAKKEKINFS